VAEARHFYFRASGGNWQMRNSSEPPIDLQAKSLDEHDRRLTASSGSDTIHIDTLGDTVRINRPPRAQSSDREILRQPWVAE
jgi:hypothetical protein